MFWPSMWSPNVCILNPWRWPHCRPKHAVHYIHKTNFNWCAFGSTTIVRTVCDNIPSGAWVAEKLSASHEGLPFTELHKEEQQTQISYFSIKKTLNRAHKNVVLIEFANSLSCISCIYSIFNNSALRIGMIYKLLSSVLRRVRKNYEKRLLDSSGTSVRPCTWNNSPPTTPIFMYFQILIFVWNSAEKKSRIINLLTTDFFFFKF